MNGEDVLCVLYIHSPRPSVPLTCSFMYQKCIKEHTLGISCVTVHPSPKLLSGFYLNLVNSGIGSLHYQSLSRFSSWFVSLLNVKTK
jgi:hypothetical protein